MHDTSESLGPVIRNSYRVTGGLDRRRNDPKGVGALTRIAIEFTATSPGRAGRCLRRRHFNVVGGFSLSLLQTSREYCPQVRKAAQRSLSTGHPGQKV